MHFLFLNPHKMAKLFRPPTLLAMLLLKLTFSIVDCTRNVGQLKEHCNSSIIADRPDYSTESFRYSEEAITGHRCFSLEVLLHRCYLTFHISLQRDDSIDFCKGLEAKRVEFLALAYYGNTLKERRKRKPFGQLFRSGDTAYDSIRFICDPKNRPANATHIDYKKLPPGNVEDYLDCLHDKSGGGFINDSISSSLRLIKTGPGGLGPVNGKSSTVVACALWTYEGNNFMYPDGLELNKHINMEFIVEVDIETGTEKGFRSVAKISKIMQEVITKFPDSLLCKYPVSTTTVPTTTLQTTITTGDPNSTASTASTTAPNETSTTTPAPVYVDLPCFPFDTCDEVDEYLKLPRGDRFSSFYDPVYSDACKCYNSKMEDSFRLGKYKYGGIHYGLPLPNTPNHYRRAPFKAVIDPMLKDCLQFYFDMDTGCAVFIMESCPGADPVVTALDVVGINIFALGSTDTESSEGLPFGAWTLVDHSVGNCGNLINDKAPRAREQVYTKKYSNDECRTILDYVPQDFGMQEDRSSYHLPQILRVEFEKKITLKPTGGQNQSFAFGARLETLHFDKAHPDHRPLYLTFVLEAITDLQTKYNFDDSGALDVKRQIISMKTPVVNVTYDPNPLKPSSLDLNVHSSEHNIEKHPLEYLQLKEDWHDEFYLKDKCVSPHIFLPIQPVTKPPPTTKDIGYESTCKCFSPKRATTDKMTRPSNVTKFVEKVSKVKPQGSKITENCFIFGHQPVTAGAGDNSTACIDGKDMKHHRVMVYFGLSCAGKTALEIMDMTIIALNHKGYPVGFWDNILIHQTEGQDCRKLLEDNSGLGSWQVRNIRAIWDYTCPPTNVRTQGFDPEETFLHDKEPHMLLFNHNVTIEDQSAKNYGFCAWWYFKHKYNNHVTHDTRNFYLDFQFVATSHIEHRPSKTTYLVTHRQPRLGFNVKTCSTDKINPHPIFKDIFINPSYYYKYVDPHRQECIIPLSQIDTFSTGMCGCFVGVTKKGEQTYRLDSSIYPENHTISEDVKFLQSCLELSHHSTNSPKKYSVVVSWKLTDSYQCKDRFIAYEVVLQAIDNEGLPMGFWDSTLVTSGDGCSKADRLGDAKVRVFPCPVSKAHVGKYNTYESTTNILHFQNIWKDKHYNWICARWRFPENYTQGTISHNLADDFQFYAQANVLDLMTQRWLTAPLFTPGKKIIFDQGGNFSQDFEIDPTIHIHDFNNYLDPKFDKESDSKRPCLIRYPPHPDYESHMCKMFHARKITVDLDNEDKYNTEWNHYKHCYKFDAFPGNEPLSMHLRFRQMLSDPTCVTAVHFALTAYNEDGFPVGRIGTSVSDRSWSYYDHPFVTDTDPRFCNDEDYEVPQETIQPIEYTMCPFYTLLNEGLTEATMSRFYKQQVNSQELPGMISFAVHPSSAPNGVCFHWAFDEQPQGQETPKFVQFYIEFFAPHSQENLVIGTEFVKRSAKFSMKYKAGDPIPAIKNPPIKCHDNRNKDPYNFFEIVPIPTDNWQKVYNYTIYPNKEMYRRCLSEYVVSKTCATRFKEEEVRPPVNPIVVIPGLLGPEDDVYNHRYDSTKGIYDGCVTEKLCFSPIDFFKGDKYSECINQMNCQLVWAVGKQPIHPRDKHLPDPEDDSEIVLELYAATKGYVALGISLDKKMGEDFVLECVKNGTSKEDIENTVHLSWNIAKSETEKVERGNIRYPPSETAGIARLVTRRSDASSVYCVFYIQSAFQARSLLTSVVYDYDLQSETYCMLTAYGEKFTYKIQDRNKTIIGIGNHNKGEWKGFATCRDHTDLSKRLTPTRRQVKILQTHGLIMTIAYMGLMSFSAFVARYYKYSLTQEYYSYPLWVWIHGATAVAAAALVLVGTILFSVGKSGWRTPLTSPFHRFMGYNAIVLTIINIPIGFYIRKQDWFHQRNAIVYLIHCVGGHFALVVGILIVMLVRYVEYAFVPCVVGHLGIAFNLLYFVIHSAMSCNRYWLNKLVSGEKKKEYTLTPFILLTQNAPLGTTWHEEYPKATWVRKIVLVVFLLVVCAFTIPVAYLIITSDHSCILEGHYEALRY